MDIIMFPPRCVSCLEQTFRGSEASGTGASRGSVHSLEKLSDEARHAHSDARPERVLHGQAR